MTQGQLSSLARIAAAAVECERKTGLPAEISAAQAGLESAWLTRMSGANNCFGIKSSPAIEGRELVTTHEWFTPQEMTHFLAMGDGRTATMIAPASGGGGRARYVVRDWFAAFPALADCFAYHAGLLQRGCYAAAWSAYLADRDLPALVGGIAAHYATDPQYARAVLAVAGSPAVVEALRVARGV